MNVKKLKLAVAALASAVGVLNASADLVLNFDDLPSTTVGQSLPVDYMGFTWQGDWGYMTGSGPSQPNVVFSQTGKTVSLVSASGAAFDFQGASFSTLASSAAGFYHSASSPTTSLIVQGWRGSTLVGTEIIKNLSVGQFTFQASNLKGVDKLVFIADGTPGGRWVMDNITTLGPQNPVVPEPTTLLAGALLLLPFGAAIIRMRRGGRLS
jgi:hypothetical protein